MIRRPFKRFRLLVLLCIVSISLVLYNNSSYIVATWKSRDGSHHVIFDQDEAKRPESSKLDLKSQETFKISKGGSFTRDSNILARVEPYESYEAEDNSQLDILDNNAEPELPTSSDLASLLPQDQGQEQPVEVAPSPAFEQISVEQKPSLKTDVVKLEVDALKPSQTLSELESLAPVSDSLASARRSCKHLHCTEPKPRCKFNTNFPEYNVGSWIKMLDPPDFSLDRSSDADQWLDSNAYAYQNECNKGDFPCHVAEPNSCRAKAMNIASYQWFPTKCSLAPFNAQYLDKILGGKTVLFIGDSLMRQMFNSWRFLTRPIWRSRNETLNIVETFRTIGGNRFIFSWSKYLARPRTENDGDQSFQKVLRLASWAKVIAEDTVDVVVLNVGHHWHKLDEEFHRYSEMVDLTLRHFQQHFKGQKIIFRTSTPGHYECKGTTKPNINVPHLTPSNDPYSWRKPIKAETQWQTKANQLGLGKVFTFLNVSNSGYRADAHAEWNIRNGGKNIDCLHWCLPGIPDFWNQFLYNALLGMNRK